MRLLSCQNPLILAVILLSVLGCNFFDETKTIEIKRGRLKFVQILKYGTVGTHGSKGWYAVSKQFYLNDRVWHWQEAFDGCSASPNEAVEVFNCFKIKDLREMAFLVRVRDGKIDWLNINDDESIKSGGHNLGEWVTVEDGKWLIFKDFFYNVETDEKRPIKGLPDYPETYFRAASPDLETVVYEGSCYYGYADAQIELKQQRENLCREINKTDKKNLVFFWLTEVRTGKAELISVSREKYDWLSWDQKKFDARRDWLKLFQQRLVWEKDKAGRYQLRSPTPEGTRKKNK